MAKKQTKKRKLKGKSILIAFILVILSALALIYIYSLKISVITVKGNTLYSEWEIIKLAGLDNYPSSMQSISGLIENKLEKDPYIKKATVKKHFITQVSIEVEENSPLFYYVPNKKTVLENGKETEANFPVPTLVNYVPNKIYDNFLEEMENTDYKIIKRMSEIKYDPNDVDDERFLITMNDGNYVYLTLNRFNKINHYIEIIKEFNNKKGILYLDSGEYFKVIE
ncbi:MAG: FtsQ-type POTRA domain-containing protein [Bacilli bacterium]|nr:FtsQ-type POTRA domain-containing protein [Bacilli bacterium]